MQALSRSQSLGCQKHAVHLSRRSPTVNLTQRGRRCRALSLQRPAPLPDSSEVASSVSLRVVDSPVVEKDAADELTLAYQAGYEVGLRDTMMQSSDRPGVRQSSSLLLVWKVVG